MTFVYEYVCGLNQDKNCKIKNISCKIHSSVYQNIHQVKLNREHCGEKSNMSNKKKYPEYIKNFYKSVRILTKPPEKFRKSLKEVQ